MAEAIIELEGVRFSRGNRLIFEDLSFTINKGEIVAILGPSGTGKTTLMRLITGQLKPDSGVVRVFGQRLDTLSYSKLMQLRRKMSMLFQNNALFSDMTVLDNVAFPLREVLNLPKELIEIVALMKLETVGLRGAAHMMPSELSGGMARRVSLARASAMDPEMMIYDEPFTGQDPITLGVLTELVGNLNRKQAMTSLVVTHDVEEVCRIANRGMILSGGKLIAFDSIERLLNSADPFVFQFMHGKSDGPVPFHFPAQAYLDELKGGGV